VQTNLEAILNPKSFSEIENKSAERGPLQPKRVGIFLIVKLKVRRFLIFGLSLKSF
jgi:hypothetical protein